MIYRLNCDHEEFHHIRGYFRIEAHGDVWFIHMDRPSDFSLLDSLIKRQMDKDGKGYAGLLLRGDSLLIMEEPEDAQG